MREQKDRRSTLSCSGCEFALRYPFTSEPSLATDPSQAARGPLDDESGGEEPASAFRTEGVGIVGIAAKAA